jgi:signal peptidase II
VRRLYLVAALTWGLDLATKIWAVNNLSARNPVELLGSFFQLTLVRNPGAAFSFATGATIVFTIISVAAVIAIVYYSVKITSLGWATALGLLLGGVLGNLTDRLFRSPGFLKGEVIDWLELTHWPVFNLADSAIVVAAFLAIVLSIRNVGPINVAKY